MTVSKELGNGVALRQIALRGLEKRELVRWVESLVTWLTSCMIVIDSEFVSTASEFTYDLAHVDVNVADGVSVEI